MFALEVAHSTSKCEMEFDFQSAFHPATPPYTDSSGAEFDEAISSLLEQSPQEQHVDISDTNELQNWLQSQPIFNAYEDPFQSLQAGLLNTDSVGVDPRGGLMLPNLQAMENVQPQEASKPVDQPKATKRKAGDSSNITKKQKSEAQKRELGYLHIPH